MKENKKVFAGKVLDRFAVVGGRTALNFVWNWNRLIASLYFESRSTRVRAALRGYAGAR